MRDLKTTLFYTVFRYLCIAPFLFLLYRYRVEGRENVPVKGPAVLLCKHQSWVDLPAVSFSIKTPMNYVAKSELFENIFGDFPGTLLEKIGKLLGPLTGKIITWLGAIPVDRQRPYKKLSSFKRIKKLIEKGEFLVVFPEGRVVKNRMGELIPGLTKMLINFQEKMNRKITFVPVGISYGTEKIFRKTLIVRFGEPIYFKKSDSDLCKTLHEKISSLTEFTTQNQKIVANSSEYSSEGL